MAILFQKNANTTSLGDPPKKVFTAVPMQGTMADAKDAYQMSALGLQWAPKGTTNDLMVDEKVGKDGYNITHPSNAGKTYRYMYKSDRPLKFVDPITLKDTVVGPGEGSFDYTPQKFSQLRISAEPGKYGKNLQIARLVLGK